MNHQDDLGYIALAWTLVAVGAGVACGALWLAAGRRVRLLPVPHVRPAPWTGLDVWIAFCVFMLLGAVVYQTLTAAGAFTLIYGDRADAPEFRERLALWVVAASFPLQFAVIVFGLCHIHGARPIDLGLTAVRLVPNVLTGYLVWLAVAPLSLGVYWAVIQFIKPDAHQLERLVGQPLMPAEVALLVFSAVVVASVMEELVFRGVLLSWQLNRGADAQFVVGVAALAIALLAGRSKEGDLNAAPVLFIAAMLPGYLIIPYLGPRPASVEEQADGAGEPPPERAAPASWRERLDALAVDYVARALGPTSSVLLALYGNALMFAAFHSAVWPSPIPLLVLSLGLAWLSYRTQSLIGPIVAHALFNAVACLVLFLPRWL